MSIRFSPFVKINVFVLQICVWAKKPKKSIADISIPTYTLKCIIVESYVGFFFWASTTLNCFTSMYHKITPINTDSWHWIKQMNLNQNIFLTDLFSAILFCGNSSFVVALCKASNWTKLLKNTKSSSHNCNVA